MTTIRDALLSALVGIIVLPILLLSALAMCAMTVAEMVAIIWSRK